MRDCANIFHMQFNYNSSCLRSCVISSHCDNIYYVRLLAGACTDQLDQVAAVREPG